MDYMLVFATIIIAIHAYTYGRWLRQNGNNTGAMGVFLLVAASVVLSVYRIIKLD